MKRSDSLIERSIHQNSIKKQSYNMEEHSWEILPLMLQPHGKRYHGVFIEGKYMVLSWAKFDLRGHIFNPRARTWTRLEGIWSFHGDVWSSCAEASTPCDLYRFNGEHVMKYNRENNIWTSMDSFLERIHYLTSST